MKHSTRWLLAVATILSLRANVAICEEIDQYIPSKAIYTMAFKPRAFLRSPLVNDKIADAIVKHGAPLLEVAKTLDPEWKALVADSEVTLNEFFRDKKAIKKLCDRAAEVETILFAGTSSQVEDTVCIVRGNLWESCVKDLLSKLMLAQGSSFSKTTAGRATLYEIGFPNGRQIFVVVPEERVFVVAKKREHALKICESANRKNVSQRTEPLFNVINGVDSQSQLWLCFLMEGKARSTVSITAKTDLKLLIKMEDVPGVELLSTIALLSKKDLLDILADVPVEEIPNLDKLRKQIKAATEFNLKENSMTFSCQVKEPQIAEFFRLLQRAL